MLKDYYSILGIATTATTADISAAYKQLAKQWHPDRNRAPDATARMQEINEAYLILKDPLKRARYDEAHARVYGRAKEERRTYEQGPRTGPTASGRAEPVMDEELENLIKEARRKAKEMLDFTLSETRNILMEGLKSVLSYLVFPLVMGLFGLMIIAARGCN